MLDARCCSVDQAAWDYRFPVGSVDAYKPVPWWAWTGRLEPELLEAQLKQMHDQGLREFFIFPIYGIDVQYMSPEYLDRIGLVVNWCREHGMRVWIYDELNWPSGVASGLVPRKHPEAIASQLHVEDRPGISAADLEALLADGSVYEVVEARPDGALLPLTGETPARREPVNVLVFRRVKSRTAGITVRGCTWTQNDPGQLDLLSSKAVRAFIDEAYQPIADAFPDEVGRTIAGFFTDEPQFASGAVPWTDGLEDQFQERFGYDIRRHLHEIAFDLPSSFRCRIDYWSLVTELASNAYTGQLAAWCAQYGMQLTGHMVHEENSFAARFGGGDIPTHVMKMQVPGCDLLVLYTNFDEPKSWYVYGAEALVKAPKHPSSAARFTGAKRVMCEAYGVVPWWKTSADEKRMTDWLVALGVNMINDNSLITDICDFRKRGISGKHFTQPYWNHEHLYYDYAARICGLSAETTLDTEVLVLYPTASWWAGIHAAADTAPALRELELALDHTIDALVRKHWDFEFLYEQILEAAEVRGGGLLTGAGTFRCIILAGISHLRPQHAAKLEEFAASGGMVLLVGSEVLVVSAEDERPINLPSALRIDDWKTEAFHDALDMTLAKSIARPWNISAGGLDGFVSAGRFDDEGRKLLFLANVTPGAKTLDVSWVGGKKVECWDADSAQRWFPEQSLGSMRFELPEDQSVWLVQVDSAVECSRPPAQFITGARETVELSGEWFFETDRPNLFSLDYKLKIDEEGSFSHEDVTAGHNWLDTDCGDCGVPLRPEDVNSYWLSAEFRLTDRIADLRLVVDSELVESCWLNGEDLGPSQPTTVWDEHNRAWGFGDKARPGANSLLLRAKPSPYNASHIAIFPVTVAEPLVLSGHFSVSRDGLALPPPTIHIGDWREKGLPHFAGTGIYRRSFSWLGGDALFVLDAGRSVAEVIVDGVLLGKRAWGPRQFIAWGLQAGEHQLEIRVTNTLAGILRRFYGGGVVSEIPACGLLSPVRIARI